MKGIIPKNHGQVMGRKELLRKYETLHISQTVLTDSMQIPLDPMNQAFCSMSLEKITLTWAYSHGV
jgi:hypothetical protein